MKFRRERILRNIKWKFRKLKILLMRRRLERSGFYEDIFFNNDTVKEMVEKKVAEWVFYLKEHKKIEIKKFKDFFMKFEEIVFPINIQECYGRKIDIKLTDNQGNEYYMSKRKIIDYFDMNKYFIGKRDTSTELLDREICYEITENATIKILSENFIKLNEDGTNSDITCKLCFYDEDSEEITLYSGSLNGEIKIKYLLKHNDEISKSIIKYCLEDVATKWYYYDVLPILEWMLQKTESLSMNITAKIDDEVFSEIEVVNGIIQKYTTTCVINEGEMHIIKKIFAKELKEFLTKKK